MTGFDPARFAQAIAAGHGGRLGIVYRDHALAADGTGWIELALPFRAELAGPDGGIATGAVAALMDMATAMAVWGRRRAFVPHATLDLRLDYLRPTTPGATLIGRGECYRLDGALALVRGVAHEGDHAEPVVHVVGSFMAVEPPARRAA